MSKYPGLCWPPRRGQKKPRTSGSVQCSLSVGHPPRRRSALRANNASKRSPPADSRDGSSSPRASMGPGAWCCRPPTLNFPWVRRGHRCRDSELASERLVSLLGAVPTGGLWAPSLRPAEGGAAGGGAAGRGWAGVAETLPRPLDATGNSVRPSARTEVPRSRPTCTSRGRRQLGNHSRLPTDAHPYPKQVR